MDCILFRHGIAVDPAEWDGKEAQRPLTPRGIEKTKLAALGLLRMDHVPTQIVSSPFSRALETANLIREAFEIKDDIQQWNGLVPDARPDRVLPWLADFPGDACVMCVGHEPHLGAAAAFLLFGAEAAGLSLKKSGACAIRFDGPPKPGEGVLRWWLMPAQLRELGKGETSRRSKKAR